jgi:CRISPR/Cas system-associated exonuclease Cas4 (RecB family)
MDCRIINPERSIYEEVMDTSWSPTKITGLLHCVQQHWYSTHSEYIPKELLPPEPAHLVQGVFLHEWAESFLKQKEFTYKASPENSEEASQFVPSFKLFLTEKLPVILTQILGQEYVIEVEKELSLNARLEPTPYKAKGGKLFAGKIDYIAFTKKEGPKDVVVVDYKSTKNTEAEGSSYALQIAFYKLLLARHMPVGRIASGIYFIKQDRFDWVLKDGQILVPYDETEVKAIIRLHMEKAREAAKQPAARNIGPHCAFCRYKNVCH